MPWRWYTFKQKYPKKDGTESTYLLKQKKWIKSNVPYKPQKRGFGKKPIWSSRFGFLDLYNRKEQQELRCPSGYTISQCFNVMRKLWYGYLKSMCDEKDIEKMKKYARAIQSVQKDMGIKTTSFPHLGIFGDQLFLNYKKGEHTVSEWHSSLEKQQEEYDKWSAKNAKKIQAHVMRPNREKGEKILTHADKSYKIRRRPSAEMLVPDVLVPDEEKGERLLVISDETPFRETIKTHVDKSYKAKRRPPAEMLVPDALVPDEEEGEELIVMSDEIPFRD